MHLQLGVLTAGGSSLWRWLRAPAYVAACAISLATSSAHAADQVSLQLKWKHQFQFAGYYAAIEKGFYRESGLEVDLREGGPNIDAGAAVAAGDADFGICTASVLVRPAERANNVVLGVIF